MAISCKSWQGGFSPEREIENIRKNKKVSGKDSRLRYRELAIKKWAIAFQRKIKELTGKSAFTYAIVATALNGDKSAWIENNNFKEILTPHLKVIALNDIFDYLNSNMSTTPASSEVGRLIQVLKSAKCIKS